MLKNWRFFLKIFQFKKMLFIGLFLLIITLICFSFFLNFIEKREGLVINDYILNNIPAIDLSILIFGVVWSSSILSIIHLLKKPNLFLVFLWSYTFLCASRILTIGLVKLNPPKNLIPLVDPLTNFFYGGIFLTKDLFYSGHTATMFLLYLCVENKMLKKILLVGTLVIGISVLIQHVHYTVDVIVAPIFTYFLHFIAKKITSKSHLGNTY